jgi:hypothetical protein
MYPRRVTNGDVLHLRAGDWVEVRPLQEILATLDHKGRLDALPYMPEMLQYSGKTFQVHKSAHKSCDTIKEYNNRSMANAVHLEGLRCDGQAHGGCQAGCLIFWKEAWLKRVPNPESAEDRGETPSDSRRESPQVWESGCDLDILGRSTRNPPAAESPTEERYSCQATEMLRATTPLAWWNPKQYVRDLTSRNVRLGAFVRYAIIAAFNMVVRLRWRSYPYLGGSAGKNTPTAVLNLRPGDMVQVRSKGEILRTIDEHRRNRGLTFDVEMFPHCGRNFRVLRRVEKIIDDRSGRMIYMRTPCLILDGVTCSGYLSRNRMFCPRGIWPYWHEVWLKRVECAASGECDQRFTK